MIGKYITGTHYLSHTYEDPSICMKDSTQNKSTHTASHNIIIPDSHIQP
jgi:hypothetical protein